MVADLLSKQPVIANTTIVDRLNNHVTVALYAIKTEGDGNCGLNLFAQKMRELAEFEQLSLIFRNEVEFIAFRHHLLTSLPELRKKAAANPYIAEFVGLLSQNSNLTLLQFSRFLKKAKTVRQIQEMQFVLAPALRLFMVESYKPSALSALVEKEHLNQSGTYVPDDALASLATRLHLKIHIVEQQEVHDSARSGQSPAFLASQRNDLADSNTSIYIIHTGGNSLSAHWALGVPTTEKNHIDFWKSVPLQPATMTRHLHNLENQINELASNVIETLSETELSLELQERLIDHLLKRLPDIYQNIESTVNNTIAHLYNQPRLLAQLSIEDYSNNIYQHAIAPYASFLKPDLNINVIIKQLKIECGIKVSSKRQQALAEDTGETPSMPLGPPTKVSPGHSRFALNTPYQTCHSMAKEFNESLNVLPIPAMEI